MATCRGSNEDSLLNFSSENFPCKELFSHSTSVNACHTVEEENIWYKLCDKWAILEHYSS